MGIVYSRLPFRHYSLIAIAAVTALAAEKPVEQPLEPVPLDKTGKVFLFIGLVAFLATAIGLAIC